MGEEVASTGIEVGFWGVAGFVFYLLIITVIGIYSSRFSSQGLVNYFLAGRTLNRFVVALSSVVSGRSSWLIIGFTGTAYMRGFSAIWAVVGYIIVEFFLFFLFAPRLRQFTEKYNAITLPDFFAERFNDHKGILRILLIIVMTIFLTSYVSAQFVGGGKAFASSFDLSQTTGVLLTAVIVLGYTVLGGFLAVSLTDVLQAFFMIFSLIILPIIAIIDFGGWNLVLAELSTAQLDPLALSVGVAAGFIGIGLGSPGNPHILVRYMSIDDFKQLRYSAVVGTIWNILMAVGALLIGIVGRAYFPDINMLPNEDTENIFPLLAHSHLPGVLFGLTIASVFAAIMSTCDSQLLVAASNIVRDGYQKMLKKDVELEDKKLVWLSRLFVLILVILAVLLGFVASDVVFWFVLFSWAGLGAAIGPVAILALFWKRTTLAGAATGMISGIAITIIWKQIEELSFIYELIPAFFISMILTVVVSLFTNPPADADKMMKAMK